MWLHVLLRGEDAEAVKIGIDAALSSERELKRVLSAHGQLAKRLAKFYPKGEWEILDSMGHPFDVKSIKGETTLQLGKPGEPLMCPSSQAVSLLPHSNVMTESAGGAVSAGNRKASRLFFCEFIDNSIEALRRMDGNGGPREPIQIILVYGVRDSQTGLSPLQVRPCARPPAVPRAARAPATARD